MLLGLLGFNVGPVCCNVVCTLSGIFKVGLIEALKKCPPSWAFRVALTISLSGSFPTISRGSGFAVIFKLILENGFFSGYSEV